MGWLYRIDLAGVMLQCAEKHDLTRVEEDCPEDVKELIAVEISKADPLKRFAESVRNSKSIAELNRILQKIYDEADFRRVWCGL
jgi:hypothetical protein